MFNSLISIIIPCYNAERFIFKTLESICNQGNVNLEILIIDDGSNDNTRKIIEEIKDERIKYYYHDNKGVSYSRNKGLLIAKGEYVMFFDADDIMTSEYIYSRVIQLKNNGSDYICGGVKKLINDEIDNYLYRGTSDDLFKEILFYNENIITCPSNYLFKKSFLLNNNLLFNEKLSSTADKYFLLECAKFTKGGAYSSAVSSLIYRVTESSMSNSFSKKLVYDNELFYSELRENKIIPKEILNESLARGYYMLSGANKIIGNFMKSVYYLVKSFIHKPNYLLSRLLV